MKTTHENISSLGPAWTMLKGEGFNWPENPDIPAKQVWQNFLTGDRIVRRFNMEGELISSTSEDDVV